MYTTNSKFIVTKKNEQNRKESSQAEPMKRKRCLANKFKHKSTSTWMNNVRWNYMHDQILYTTIKTCGDINKHK